jgi:hypothetical protein
MPVHERDRAVANLSGHHRRYSTSAVSPDPARRQEAREPPARCQHINCRTSSVDVDQINLRIAGSGNIVPENKSPPPFSGWVFQAW